MKTGKLEKKVPTPVVHSKQRYPWDQREAGDWVLIIAEEEQSLFKLKRMA